MKETWQVIFSGVGGQGLMLAGKLLGDAATGYEGKYAVMTSAYGVESRGTFAKSDCLISSSEIDYPEVLKPDVVIALAAVAYKKYAPLLAKGTVLLYDDSIEPLPSYAEQICLPLAKIAKEAGNPLGINLVSLGVLVQQTGIVQELSVINAIKDEFAGREKQIMLNLQSFQAGIRAKQI
ncbi:MAG: 2-oxoacid:acceptor oxidoreductase family protein [Firmicutes bacterium]|nr:2-oxoacid:acceptor oxidoreductase family protein [Bacillota bacterium]